MSVVPLIFTIAVTQRTTLKCSIITSYEYTCYSVTVLQFQNNYYQKVKNKLYIYIYIYIYIDIEVFFGMGGSILRTATLQRCNSECLNDEVNAANSEFSHKKIF